MQILRIHIEFKINLSSRLNAKNFDSVANNFNRALMLGIRENTHDLKKYQSIVLELNPYILLTGLYELLEQIIVTKSSHLFDTILFLFTISHIHKLKYFKTVDCLITINSKDQVDSNCLIIGLITVLRQFNANVIDLYLD